MQRLTSTTDRSNTPPRVRLAERLRRLLTPQYLVVAGLIAIWVLVLAAFTSLLPRQLASWLTFFALLITPGYLLGDIVTWRLELDWIERLALALPLGITVLALPGITALLLHLTLFQLAMLWALASGLVIIFWLIHEYRIRHKRPRSAARWTVDELAMVALLAIAFIVVIPTLSLYKIDGDAYAVNSFTADALAGLPLNETEPIFGTDLGPGVRMVFNQSLTMNYLWSYLATYGPNGLVATASKSMLALWALLAAYTLGKAAGNGSRRFGLFVASIQFLFYLAAPFFRGDNVSLFFFERINADKFMVTVTMLPVVFAFAIMFVRTGSWQAWAAAALATFAVSVIHPLIAAMLALAIGAFGALHLLMNLRQRQVWMRTVLLGCLIGIVMFMPLVQLVLSRGEAQLAASYPTSFEGWEIGQKQIPVLPFVHVDSLDFYGPIPKMSDLEPDDAFETNNPFLIWRFVVNMGRRRLILFDINDYISDPSLIMEPPYFLALLLLPMFFWRLRRDLAAQFVVSVSLAVLFVMFNPLVTPLIGSFVMPWILWRFVWLLPYALIFAMASQTFLNIAISLASRLPGRLSAAGATTMKARSFAPLLFILFATLLLSPGIARNIRNLNDRVAFPYAYPTPSGLFARLNQETDNEAATVLADWDLSVTIPAYVANAHIIAHRAPTTSEIFPADQQDLALGRLLDQDTFFNTPYLTEDSVAILAEYDAGFVIANSGSELDAQLRLSPQWFEWLIDDQSFSLYKVKSTPAINDSIKGNMALLQRDWQTAETHYQTALQSNGNPLLALRGLAKSAHKQGQFEAAEAYLERAITLLDLPILHYQKGQLYLDQGRVAEGIAQFDEAQRAAPYVPAFHVALGDACLGAGLEDCARSQYKEAVSLQDWSDETAGFIAEADLWRQRGFTELGLPLYEQAFDSRPSEYNAFVLISVYRELGLFDRAITLTHSLRNRYPLSAEVVALEADLVAAQGNYDEAINLLRQAVSLHEIQVQESTETRLALARALINDGRIIEAAQEIAYAADLDPNNPSGYSLQGDLFHEQKDSEAAVEAYQRALELDPTRTGVYVALSNELRLSGGSPNDLMAQLQMALRVDEDEATLLIALGDQWQRIGNTGAAIDAYQAALEQLTPFTQDRRSRPFQSTESRAFAFARIAATYEDLGEKQAALNYLRSAIAAAPELAWPQVLMGDALRRYNDVDAAVAAYNAAIDGDPEYVDAYVRLAELYEATGEPERAQSLYEQALELTGSNDPGAIAELIYASLVSQPATLAPSLASDETLFNAALVAAPLLGDALDGNQPKSVAKRSDLITPTGLYQEYDETDRAVQLYLQRLQQGEEEGWPEAALARYHKELGDLFLAREELDLAIAAYAKALELDPWWPEARLGLAEALSLQGESDEALGNLETAVSMAPGSVEAQIALADALHAQGRATEAMTIYINTARKYPGNGRALVALARAWRDRDRYYLAEIAFLDTIATNPGSAYAYVGLAELKMDLESYEEAGALLEQAIAIDRNNVSSYVRTGELEERLGDMEAALASYQHAVTLSSSDRTLNLTLIDSLVRLGDYTTAMAYAQEALDQRPDDAELLLRLGNIERLYGNYAEALSTISAAQANDPANSRIYIALAEIYLDLGQPVAALSAYGQAIEIQPDEATYYIAASQVWATQGELEVAFDLLNAGLNQVGEPSSLYTEIASLQLQQGDTDAAHETLSQGLRQLGENVPMILAMGDYFVNRANFDQVVERYNQALTIQLDNADVHIALGDLYLLRSQIDEAIETYREAIRLEPTTAGHYLALGNAFEINGQSDEAETAYRQAIVATPSLVSGYLNLAALYQGQERWDEAAATIEKGLVMLPASGQLLTRFAQLKLTEGEREQAIALLDEALAMSPTAATLIARSAVYIELDMIAEAQADLEAALLIEPTSVEALVALGDLHKAKGDDVRAEEYYVAASEAAPGVPTGYLRMSTMAREREDRDGVVYWNDLARQADPGGLVRPGD